LYTFHCKEILISSYNKYIATKTSAMSWESFCCCIFVPLWKGVLSFQYLHIIYNI